MFTEMATRKYEQTRRAAQQDETRARIVEALMALHEELGPRNSTVKAVAERAGVQRLTVYRHFPDEGAMLSACTSRWLELHPPPGPADWQDAPDPATRTRRALRLLYGYYRGTERMWTVSHRDEDEIPALKEAMDRFRDYLGLLRDDLAAGWADDGGPLRRIVLGHALRFTTWASLKAEGLDDEAMARLVAAWVAAADDGTGESGQ